MAAADRSDGRGLGTGLRGGDVACTPVFLGFLLVGTDSAAPYAQAESSRRRYAPRWRQTAQRCGLRGYLRRAAGAAGGRAGAGGQRHGQQPHRGMPGHTAWTDTPSPAARRKAVKARSEQTGFRQAHLQDGAALCRFLYEMKSRPEAYTELSAAALLHRYRTEQADFLEDSFETIAAYGPYAAVVHYAPHRRRTCR